MRTKIGRVVATLVAAVSTVFLVPSPASADNAVVSETCYNGWFAFTVTASGGDIPAGSVWESSWLAASSFVPQYTVSSQPGVITSTPRNAHYVDLTNPSAIPAGTTVVLVPSGYPLTTKSPLRLVLDGYGGRVDRSWDTQNGDGPNC